MIHYLKRNQKLKKYEEKLLDSGCPRITSCTSAPIMGHICYVHPEATDLLLEELHEGIFGSHTKGRSLSHKAITQGYWWPGMQKEAQEYVKKCDQCHKFAPNIHQPRGVLNPLSSPWSFAQWGLDIVGLFPKAARNKRYLLVDTDYFTKWVEAESLANIRDVDSKKFI